MKHPLPRGWQEKKLIDFSPLQRGFDLPNSKIINGEYPIVYSNGIKAYHNEYKCKGVGVVTGRSGTIGKVTYVEKDYWPHNTSLWVTDFKGNLPKFVFYLLSYIDLSKYDAGTSVPTLNRNDVHKITVLVPPLDEQKRIAEVLSLCDKLIENLNKLIEKKEIYKKGVMQRVLTGKVRFNGFTDEWETVRLGDILTYEQPNNYIVENDEYSDEYKCPVLTAGKTFILGYTNENFGIYNKLPVIIFDDFTTETKYVNFPFKVKSSAIKILSTNKHNLKIIYELMKMIKFNAESHKRYFISEYQYLEIKIPPSIEEQNKIAELLTLIDKDIEILKQLLHLRKLQKKGLMQKLLTGEVRI